MDLSSEFAAIIEEEKQTAQTAKFRKGQRATNKQSRQELMFEYANVSRAVDAPNTFPYVSQMLTRRWQAKPLPANMQTTSFIGFCYPPCTKSLEALQSIKISELRLETHHTKRVLFVGIFTKSVRYASVQSGVEDEVGEADFVALYNTDPRLKAKKALPKDAIFAIKEPFYKTASDGRPHIRIGMFSCRRVLQHLRSVISGLPSSDHPSNLIRLPDTHDLVPLGLQPRLVELDKPAEAHKADGNRAFKAKDYLSALSLYTQGISGCGEGDTVLKSDLLRNRAIINLHLQRHEAAATDALASIIGDTDVRSSTKKSNAKAYYRAGCALYHQGQYDEALSRFRQSLDLLPGDGDCLREIGRTEARLR